MLWMWFCEFMDATLIIAFALVAGGAIMVFSIAFMVIIFISDFLFYRASTHNFMMRILDYASVVLCVGLSLFMFSLSLIALHFLIEGIGNGEYRLDTSRHGRSILIINWDRNPVWFMAQSCLFVATFIYLQYSSIKTLFQMREQLNPSTQT
jgi:hypothetical protein